MGISKSKLRLLAPGFVVGSLWPEIIIKSANYSLSPTDYTVVLDTTLGDITVNLPASPSPNQICNLKKIATAHTLTVNGNGKQIDGSSSTTITTLNQSVTVQYSELNGVWYIL